MAASSLPTPGSGPIAIAQTLLDTLHHEEAAMHDLQVHFERQLDALRERHADLIEQATEQTHELMSHLDRLRQMRERQMRLLGRVLQATPSASLEDLAEAMPSQSGRDTLRTALLEARAALKQQVLHTQKRCSELEFALQYAVQLSRDMLMAVQGLDVPPPAGVYTASGQTTASTPRSLVNRIG